MHSARQYLVCLFLFDLILYVPSTIFQLNRDGSSWIEPVLGFFFAICDCLFLAALLSPAGKRTDISALLYVMFYCGCVTFPYGVLGKV